MGWKCAFLAHLGHWYKKINFRILNFFPQDLSETERQQLKQREDYLKKKRDLLLATKKESKNNVPPPPNTDQKEEESPPKEVKHFHIGPWVLSVQESMLLLKGGNGLKRTRVLPLIFPSCWFCRSFGLDVSVMKLALVGFSIIKSSWITSVYEWIKCLCAPSLWPIVRASQISGILFFFCKCLKTLSKKRKILEDLKTLLHYKTM